MPQHAPTTIHTGLCVDPILGTGGLPWQAAMQAAAALPLTQKEAALQKFRDDLWLVSPDGDDGLIGIGVSWPLLLLPHSSYGCKPTFQVFMMRTLHMEPRCL